MATTPSFLFIVNGLTTNDNDVGGVAPRTVHGRWQPPEVARGFHAQEAGYVYRWSNGTITAAPAYTWDAQYNGIYDTSTTDSIWPEEYRSATVFYCNHFDNFFTARGNATTRDIASPHTDPADTWQPLSFLHENNISRVDHAGDEQYLAVRHASWIEQLLPNAYRRHTSHGPVNGGLAGLLPIVIALVAFSCPDHNSLYEALVYENAWRGHRWVPHQHPTGRIEHRGVVVFVYVDPENPHGSSANTIQALENGPTPLFQ